jgi:hypothetical protein
MVRAPEGVSVIGIDELTAAVAGLDEGTSISPPKFKVFGVGAVHVLRGSATHKYHYGEIVELH